VTDSTTTVDEDGFPLGANVPGETREQRRRQALLGIEAAEELMGQLAGDDYWMSAYGISFEEASAWAALPVKDKLLRYSRELNPELMPYLEPMGGAADGMWMLRHPLLFDVPAFLPPKAYNARLAAKEEQYHKKLDAGDWESALGIVEKPYRLAFVENWQGSGRLPHRALRECLAFAWTASEYPGRAIPKKRTLRLFRLAGWMSDTTGEVNDHDAPARPLIPLRLWRGSTARYQRGLAWTADPERAAWFANRWHDGAKVWECTVPPARLLASFNGRGEAEFVCDVQGLVVRPVAEPQS
jgi:hypothetical protein